jgi:Icc protein
MINILQITDTHFFSDPAGELYGVNTRQSLNAVLKHAGSFGVKSDLLLLTGDLSHDETDESYEALNALIQPLGLPTYCLPGNHDILALLQKNCRCTTPSNGLAYAAHDHWMIVILDTTIPGKVEGYIREDVLNRLDDLLARHASKYVLVAVHHNPLNVGSAWMDRIGVQNGEAFFKVLCKYSNVKAVICGHIHQELFTQVNGIAVYGTPSSCFQFTPNTPEAEIDNRPPGYRILTLHENGSFDTQVYWVDK